MGERKVLNKYYSPDFDPDKIKRCKNPRDKQFSVTMMLPMTMRCNTCGNYLYIGRKFNMKKENCLNEDYVGIKIHRFYFKCDGCHAKITFKTDPKNHDYLVEHGAKRNYEARKDAQQEEIVLREMRETEEEGNAMKLLENKTYDTKREMEILDALDDVKQENKRKAQITHDQLLEAMIKNYEEDEDEVNNQREAAKEKFRLAREKKLEEQEENKAKELRLMLNSFQISAVESTLTNPSQDQIAKKSSLGSKIKIVAKKIKKENDSTGNGRVSLVDY